MIYITKGWLISAMIIGAGLFSACEDGLELGKTADESHYQGIYENTLTLSDVRTNTQSILVDLYKNEEHSTYTTDIRIELKKVLSKDASIKVSVDADYLAVYNAEHDTDFELYPGVVTLEGDGVVAIDAGLKSVKIGLSIARGEVEDVIEKDKTYLLPLSISEQNTGLEINETNSHCVYLITDKSGVNDCDKSENHSIKGFLFFEVNDVNPLNAFSFELENGKLLWDVVVLFAANINYDKVEGRPYLYFNPNVRYLLDNNEKFIQPLRQRGIKVLLGILGNHDVAGVAQLSDVTARDFARELAEICRIYKLDGVNFDDEYSKDPDLSNPVFVERSTKAAARLCYETKRCMPEKMVAVYAYGKMYGESYVDNTHHAREWMDVVVPDYPDTENGVFNNILPGLSLTHYAGISMEFHDGRGPNLNNYFAKQLKSKGYGWFMGFAANPLYYTKAKTNDKGQVVAQPIWDRLANVTDLYGLGLKAPAIYYEKNDPTPYPYGMLGN